MLHPYRGTEVGDGSLNMDSGMVSNHNRRGYEREAANRGKGGAEGPGGPERRERRSGYDRRMAAGNRPGYVERRRGWLDRGRRLLSRYREPLIGLGVAAATAPLALGGGQAGRGQRAKSSVEDVASTRAGKADLEERVAQRWGQEEEASVREDTIRGAVLRYGISQDLAADIYDIALDEGIDPDVAYGLVRTESSFEHQAVSSVGARGLTQLMPATAQWLKPGLNLDNLFNRELNLHIGFGYLDRLISKYEGDLRLALLAYNRGPGTVDGILDQGGDPSNGYADRVLSG